MDEEKYTIANTNVKKAGVAILISEQTSKQRELLEIKKGII